MMFRNCRKPTSSTQNGPARLTGAGYYDELEYILRNEVKPLPRTPVSQDSVYFLSVFQTDGHISRLEETWKTWSGADYILWKCPEKLKLRRVTFFKSTNDTDIYTFIVLCECEDGLSICDVAREFVERLKDRRCGLVGLYQIVEHRIGFVPNNNYDTVSAAGNQCFRSYKIQLNEIFGYYDELEYILRNEVKPLPRTPVSQDSVYFLSVFQTDGHISRLEETCKTWSGADYILWKCPEKLKLRRVTYFKSTNGTDIYTFIVLCECEDGLSICDVAREFVEGLKDRRCGLVGLYQVERYYIASKQR